MSRRNELIRRLLSRLTNSEFENLVRVREEARHIPAPRRQREARSIPTPRRPVPAPRKMGVKQLIRYFENNPIPPYRPVPISSIDEHYINTYMLLTGWEVRIGGICARGLEWVSAVRPRAQFLLTRTDLGRWITFLFFSYWDLKVSGKFYCSLQPMCVEEGRVRVVIQSARMMANQNKTLEHDFWLVIYIITIKLSLE